MENMSNFMRTPCFTNHRDECALLQNKFVAMMQQCCYVSPGKNLRALDCDLKSLFISGLVPLTHGKVL